jgi:DNA-binding transcriptional LysR family regulator
MEQARTVLSLQRLRVFREVVRHSSFSAAAKALNYSQPAVSHHVSRLESEIGARVLDRAPGDVFALTDAGSALMIHADALLERAEEAERDLAALVGKRAEVRIGAFSTASSALFVEALTEVRKVWSDLPVRLIEGEADEMLSALRERRIEIAVVFDDPMHPLEVNGAIECCYVLNDPMLLAMPACHPLARKPDITLTDLRSDVWILGAGPETACSLILLAACEQAGFSPTTTFHSGNYGLVQELVAADLGVALVPRLAADPHADRLVLRELSPPAPFRRIALATRRRPGLSAGATALLSSLEAVCKRSKQRLGTPYVA